MDFFSNQSIDTTFCRVTVAPLAPTASHLVQHAARSELRCDGRGVFAQGLWELDPYLRQRPDGLNIGGFYWGLEKY